MRTLSLAQKIRIVGKSAFHPRTPLSAKLMLLGGLLYGVLPVDLIPDLLPLLGIADDAVVILAVVMAFLHLTKDLRKTLEGEDRK
ncbi:hypothetical protein A2881_00370 [Candidatus Peribacteria bacterium RIFCSPHIGHO2_01_FULL_55_13]|nr:MAG: hypothetical protein A2881_00370 [Candidatus Peribacteria bacterium RIFCSPHIGHO2_01_FULL_55_13]OGJ65223.1 MAG: hypothetical protein A3F36_04135 [Candidatus Peribacteria bacterium RIFCSPHIGHO2_12_FULL_55_11]